MIKTSIIGDIGRNSRELLRILVNHPDISFITLDLGTAEGKRLDLIFPELTGDTTLVTSRLSTRGCDVLFVCARPEVARAVCAASAPSPDNEAHDDVEPLKIIDFTGRFFDPEDNAPVRGVCELWRKALVRGATKAIVASPAETAVTIALLPFAKNLLLNNTIKVAIQSSVLSERPDRTADNISRHLSTIQSSFKGPLLISHSTDTLSGGLTAEVRFTTATPLDELQRMFDDFYDDHNFVYRLTDNPVTDHVLNTNKCFASIKEDHGEIVVRTALDDKIKGGAGTAVHIMNLMFKLHERAGLDLKNSY